MADKKGFRTLSGNEEVKIIEAVQVHKELWDQTASEYKMKPSDKNILWDGVARKVGLYSFEHAKWGWSLIRGQAR